MAPTPEVVFGISGSISAYKALDVIRHLRAFNLNITPVLSSSAHRFVTPWSVETLSESPIIQTEMNNGSISHLSMVSGAKVMVICPASANMIAKLASGQANDLLSAAFLSFTGTKLLFPAMHSEMYKNPITQANMATLSDSGVTIIPPDDGPLACGDIGTGRLPAPHVIAQLILAFCKGPMDLSGQHITITCGGTSEPIDPVRSITNKSTGLLGHTMANIAAGFGARVRLIRTVQRPTLSTIACIEVQTAQNMADALLVDAPCDALVMAAAVSDFTVSPFDTKQARGSYQSLHLTPTPDILATFNQQKSPQCKSIGFCLTDDANALDIGQKKRIAKGCDVMVVNGPEAFGTHYRDVHILSSDKTVPIHNARIEALACMLLTSI